MSLSGKTIGIGIGILVMLVGVGVAVWFTIGPKDEKAKIATAAAPSPPIVPKVDPSVASLLMADMRRSYSSQL